MRMQIHKPQSLLTFGVVVLMATLVRGVQLDSTTESGPLGGLTAMETSANAIRFFGAFNFTTPAETGQALRYILSLSALRRCPHRGTACAYSPVMFKKPENMNTQDGALLAIAAEDFKAQVLESKQPALVEFWAPWSRPCQVFDSVLQEVASSCAGKVNVVKVNADDSLDLSLWYDIQSVPTLIYFVAGNPCLRIVGTATKEAILAKLKPFSQQA